VLRDEVPLRPDQLHAQPFEVVEIEGPAVSLGDYVVSLVLVGGGQGLSADEDENTRVVSALLDAIAVALELGQPVPADGVREDDAAARDVRSNDRVATFVARPAQRVDAGIVRSGKESRTEALKVPVVRNTFEAVDGSVSRHSQSIQAARAKSVQLADMVRMVPSFHTVRLDAAPAEQPSRPSPRPTL
jgi:hypothetical protein